MAASPVGGAKGPGAEGPGRHYPPDEAEVPDEQRAPGLGPGPDLGHDELAGLGEGEDNPGDPACWAGLVCPSCGGVLSEGHQPGCTEAPTLA